MENTYELNLENIIGAKSPREQLTQASQAWVEFISSHIGREIIQQQSVKLVNETAWFTKEDTSALWTELLRELDALFAIAKVMTDEKARNGFMQYAAQSFKSVALSTGHRLCAEAQLRENISKLAVE